MHGSLASSERASTLRMHQKERSLEFSLTRLGSAARRPTKDPPAHTTPVAASAATRVSTPPASGTRQWPRAPHPSPRATSWQVRRGHRAPDWPRARAPRCPDHTSAHAAVGTRSARGDHHSNAAPSARQRCHARAPHQSASDITDAAPLARGTPRRMRSPHGAPCASRSHSHLLPLRANELAFCCNVAS